MPHTCHAIGCSKRVPPDLFLCKPHWFQLPARLRSLIWRHYRPGQCDDMNITREYAKAAKECLLALAKKEGREISGNEPELTLYDYLSPDPEV